MSHFEQIRATVALALHVRYVWLMVDVEEWSFYTGTRPVNFQDGWVRIETSTAPQPFSVRLARSGGRLRIVGIALDNDIEITTDVLRSLRLGKVLEEFFDPEDEVDVLALGHVVETLANVESSPRVRRGNPPSDEDLERFAAAYSLELNAHPRRAMHEVTKKGGHIPMARSTGYRWLALARDRGFLSEDES